jgi:Methyltransferase domain
LSKEEIRFEVASSTNYPSDNKYDLIAFFDSLHDMGDPVGAAAHALKSLKKPDGVVMIVEPFANDKIEDNLNPMGRMFCAASSIACVPPSQVEKAGGLGILGELPRHNLTYYMKQRPRMETSSK